MDMSDWPGEMIITAINNQEVAYVLPSDLDHHLLRPRLHLALAILDPSAAPLA